MLNMRLYVITRLDGDAPLVTIKLTAARPSTRDVQGPGAVSMPDGLDDEWEDMACGSSHAVSQSGSKHHQTQH